MVQQLSKELGNAILDVMQSHEEDVLIDDMLEAIAVTALASTATIAKSAGMNIQEAQVRLMRHYVLKLETMVAHENLITKILK